MAERTFVLTDVESSTALWERFPEQMAAAIAAHELIIAGEVARHGGEVIRERGEGDSLFAVFATPDAAVQAAAAFTRALGEASWPEETPIRTRVAVYTGEAQQREGDYYGTTVNRAARVRSLAFGGQILLGESTAGALTSPPSGTALVDLGPRALKDLASPEHVFELRLIDANMPPEPLSDAGASNALWIERLLASGFVDRHDARRDLIQAWSTAAAGDRVLALIDGEPGMGKTTLAAAIAQHVLRDDGLVLYGRWDEDLLASFQALREALGTYARSCPRSILRADLRDYADEIARLLPEVIRRAEPDAAPADGAVQEAERLRLFEAIDAWLVAIASRRPVCLVLDDLQWADRASILLLLHLMRAPVRAPIFVLITFRRDALVDGDLAQYVPDLAREGNVYRISLDGLASEDVADLLRSFGGAGSPTLARDLQAETGGNPLFLREIVQHLAASGQLDAEREDVELPDSVRELVRWRLRPLPIGAKEALAVASVIGLEFDVDLLAAARDVDPASLMDGLESACRAGLLHEVDATGQRYAFSHAVVRRALVDDFTVARRAGYHWRIGDALEERDPPASPSELAYHFCAAVTPQRADKAISYARAAAGQAMEELAFETAIHHLQRAMEIQQSMRPAEGALRCALLLALGEALDRSGDYAKRAETFVAAADLAREIDRTDLFVRAAISYGGVLPAATSMDAKGLELLEEALVRVGAEPSRDRALLLGRLAHSLQLVPPRARRAELADEAVRIARGLDDPRVLAEALIYRCFALDGPDDMKDQLAAAHEIRALAEELGRRELVLRAMHLRSDGLFESGDVNGLRETIAEMDELARELRYPEYTRVTRAWDAVFAVIEGRYDEALEIADDVRAQMTRMDHPQKDSTYQGLIHPISWLRGDMAKDLPVYEEMAAQVGEDFLVQVVLAWVAGEAGNADLTSEVLGRLSVDDLRTLDKNYTWWAGVVGLTDAVALAGHRGWAEVLYEMLLPYADRFAAMGSTAFFGAARYHLGVLATVLERYDDAVDDLEAAIEKHQELNARPFLALTQVSLARALLARGEPGDANRASELISSAVATADELGLGAVKLRASQLALRA